MQTRITKAFELRDRIKAASNELARRKARGDLLSFIRYVRSDYRVNWHHVLVCKEIDNWLVADPPYNLILSMPAQHGKSEICSRYLPAYLFGKNPDISIIAASYGSGLIEDMSRDCQRIIDTPEYHGLFSETTIISKGHVADETAIRRSDAFTIQRRRGRYRCAGVKGPLTGHPADWGIIDDPHKDREEAESKTTRESTVDWYYTVFRTRLHGEGKTLMLLTRWHVDDLAGHVLKKMKNDPKADKWKYIRFPAIYPDDSESHEYLHPEDKRKPGEALWPYRQNEKQYIATKASNVSYNWYSMYQQLPTMPGGNVIKRHWLNRIRPDQLPYNLEWVRGWDLAVSEKQKADFTASGQMAIDIDGRIYVRGFVHEQVEWPQGKRMFKSLARSELVPVGIETSAQQKGFFDDLIADPELREIPIYGYSPDKSKLIRAQPWIARAEAGKFFIVDGPGADNYIDELIEFTGIDDTHDDQVDWTSLAYRMLAGDVEPELEVLGIYEVG
jgi:predicted phage terminase large subunit-like protein